MKELYLLNKNRINSMNYNELIEASENAEIVLRGSLNPKKRTRKVQNYIDDVIILNKNQFGKRKGKELQTILNNRIISTNKEMQSGNKFEAINLYNQIMSN